MSLRSTNSPLAAARDRQARVESFLAKHAGETFTPEQLWLHLWRYGTRGQIENAVAILRGQGRAVLAVASKGGTQQHQYRAAVKEKVANG